MIGLGTYAFFWQHSDRVDEPLSLTGALEATRAQDVGLFQICDYAPLLLMTAAEVAHSSQVTRGTSAAGRRPIACLTRSRVSTSSL